MSSLLTNSHTSQCTPAMTIMAKSRRRYVEDTIGLLTQILATDLCRDVDKHSLRDPERSLETVG